MAHWFDEFHYFSPAEKRGIVLLLGAILIVVVLLVLSPFSSADEPTDPEAEQKFQAEYEAFMASIHEVDSLRYQPRTYEPRTYQPRQYERRTYPQRTYQADTAKRETPQIYLPDTTRLYPKKLDGIVLIPFGVGTVPCSANPVAPFVKNAVDGH